MARQSVHTLASTLLMLGVVKLSGAHRVGPSPSRDKRVAYALAQPWKMGRRWASLRLSFEEGLGPVAPKQASVQGRGVSAKTWTASL